MYVLDYTDKTFQINDDIYQKGDIARLHFDKNNVAIQLKHTGISYKAPVDAFVYQGTAFTSKNDLQAFISENFFFVGSQNGGGGSVQINVDSDFISKTGSNNTLSLADKTTVTDINEQKVFYVKRNAVLNTAYFKANTRYVFKFKHDLQNVEIVFPEGVTLDFADGGVLLNGTLKGNYTSLRNMRPRIFNNIKILSSGTWNIYEARLEWFVTHKNGYSIDYKTFQYRQVQVGETMVNKMQFKYNGIWYDAGHLSSQAINPDLEGWIMQAPDGRPINDDTLTIKQLLNFCAKRTVIGRKGEIFMVKPWIFKYDPGKYKNLSREQLKDDADECLYLDSRFKGKTIVINGLLKCVPNRAHDYNLMILHQCDHITIEGDGGIEGDICEHVMRSTGDGSGQAGEAGMLLTIWGSKHIKVKNINIRSAWGDNIFTTWERFPMIPGERNHDNYYHTYQDLTLANARRTGVGHERGDFSEFIKCDFDGNRNIRGVGTFAGVDIEPFGDTSAPRRFCLGLRFIGNRFVNYTMAWGALRLERALSCVIDNNTFARNGSDIQLLNCATSSEDITIFEAVELQGTDRRIMTGGVTIINNHSENSHIFLETYDPTQTAADNLANMVTMHSNNVHNCNHFINKMNFKHLECFANSVWHCNRTPIEVIRGDNVRIYNNHFYHLGFVEEGNLKNIHAVHSTSNLLFKNIDLRGDFVFENNIVHDFTGGSNKGSNIPENRPVSLFPNDPLTPFKIKNAIGFNVKAHNVRIVNNRIPWKLNISTDYRVLQVQATGQLEIYNTYDIKELGTKDVPLVVKGDKVVANGRKGTVLKGAWLRWLTEEDAPGQIFKYIDTPGTGNGTKQYFTTEKIVIHPEKNIQFYSITSSWFERNYQYPWLPTEIKRIEPTDPHILWEGVGVTDNIINVTRYNTTGRREIETTTGILWEFNGNKFVNVNAKKIGSTAERPADHEIDKGFQFYNLDNSQLEIFNGPGIWTT